MVSMASTCCSRATAHPRRREILWRKGQETRECAVRSEVLANIQDFTAPCALTKQKSATHVLFVSFSVWSGGLGRFLLRVEADIENVLTCSFALPRVLSFAYLKLQSVINSC